MSKLFGLIVHHDREQAIEQAIELATWLQQQGHRVRLPRSDAAIVAMPELGVADEAFAAGLDVAVSLGGDGSILRAVELTSALDVPLLGVNYGELGYLAAIEPADAHDAVKLFLSGEYEVETRMMLQATVTGSIDTPVHHALNEIVLERTAEHNTIRLAVGIDGDHFHTYPADGIIVATPTGSTAYALSARGPIVAATHRALLLTPVSPHMLFDRSLLLEPESELELRVDGHRPAAMSVDGRKVGTLVEGDSVSCTASDRQVRLVLTGPRRFHDVLKAKFGLTDR